MGALPGAAEKTEIHEGNVHYRPCPDCGNLMNRSNYGRISGVILDSCREHGLWFDRDELRRVLAFVEAGGLDRSQERQIQELEDKKRLVAIAPPMPMEWLGVREAQGPGLLDLLGAVEGFIQRVRR